MCFAAIPISVLLFTPDGANGYWGTSIVSLYISNSPRYGARGIRRHKQGGVRRFLSGRQERGGIRELYNAAIRCFFRIFYFAKYADYGAQEPFGLDSVASCSYDLPWLFGCFQVAEACPRTAAQDGRRDGTEPAQVSSGMS